MRGVELLVPVAFALELLVRLAGGVDGEVGLEADHLLDEEGDNGADRRLLGQLCELACALGLDERVSSLRDEHHVLVDVARGLVVLSVRELPGEVGVPGVGVHGPAEEVVDPVVLRERGVAALVCQDPEPDHRERHEHRVARPQREPHVLVGHHWNHPVRHHAEHHHEEQISHHIRDRLHQISLETLLRDRVQDVRDREVRHVESVSVRVDRSQVRRDLVSLGERRRHRSKHRSGKETCQLWIFLLFCFLSFFSPVFSFAVESYAPQSKNK